MHACTFVCAQSAGHLSKLTLWPESFFSARSVVSGRVRGRLACDEGMADEAAQLTGDLGGPPRLAACGSKRSNC